MRYPQTRLLLIATRYATYPMLEMVFADGKPIVLSQQWVPSPPRGRFC